MDMQASVTNRKNVVSPVPTMIHRRRVKNVHTTRSAADLELRTSLPTSFGQPTDEIPVGQAVAQLSRNGTPSTSQAGIDYARLSDKQLIAAARSSDGGAFEELSKRHVRSVSKVVYCIVGHREDTEDVVQESLLKAYCRLSEFRESCSFSTWITAIAINTARMLLRRKRARPELSLIRSGEDDQTDKIWDLPDPSPSAEQRCAKQESLKFMSCAVNGLPAQYRSVVEQYHAQEKSLREAADALGISVASTKSRLFRARRILRFRMQAQRISVVGTCL